VSRAKTAERIVMLFGGVNSRGSEELGIRCGTYGRHLANMTEQSVLDDSDALLALIAGNTTINRE